MLTIKAYFFPFCSGAKCLRTLISTKFSLFLTPSLLFLDILSNGPIILSHTFFSICITSRQYLTYKHFQYGRLKNIDRFFYTFFSIIFCFTFSQLGIRCFTFHLLVHCSKLLELFFLRRSIKCFSQLSVTV